MACVWQGDHTVLPATHTRTIPAFTPQPFGWYLMHLPTKGWPGWVDLCGWLHTEINVPHRELNPDMVTHPSTNRARRRLTSVIETNALPLCRTTTKCLTVIVWILVWVVMAAGPALYIYSLTDNRTATDTYCVELTVCKHSICWQIYEF